MKPTQQDLDVVADAMVSRPLTLIRTAQSYVEAAQRLLALRSKVDYLAQRKAELQAPLKGVQAVVKEWFGPAEDQLQVEIDAVKDALCGYIETRVPEAAAEAQNQLEAGDKTAMLEAMSAIPAVPGITIRDVPDFSVVGPVPEKYLVRAEPTINRKLVLADLKKGIAIPGIKREYRVDLSVSLTKGEK